MRRYYKLLIVPAIIIIIAGFFSGFSNQSSKQIAEDLLTQRTDVLQKAYFGKTEMDQAEKYLNKIETYPLLSDDIGYLRNSQDTDMDRVNSMTFLDIKDESKSFHYVCLSVKIRWHMRGASSDYVSDNEYTVILESTKNGYKLSEFNPK